MPLQGNYSEALPARDITISLDITISSAQSTDPDNKEVLFLYQSIIHTSYTLSIYTAVQQKISQTVYVIYLMPHEIILKLFSYLENSTKNVIPTHHNIFAIAKRIRVFELLCKNFNLRFFKTL